MIIDLLSVRISHVDFGRDRIPTFIFRYTSKIPFYVMLAVNISVAVNILHIDSLAKIGYP